MLKYSNVIGIPILCLNDGKKTGNVKDIFLSAKQKKVVGLLLDSLIFNSKKFIVLEDILNFSDESIVLSDCSCIKNLNHLENREDLKSKSDVIGLRIFTKSGNEVGLIKNILFDEKSGNLDAIEVSDGIINDLLNGIGVIPICGNFELSKDVIIVGSESVEDMIGSFNH